MKKQDRLKKLLKLRDKDNLSFTELKERKRLKRSGWREKPQLLSMRKELNKKDSKESKDSNMLD